MFTGIVETTGVIDAAESQGPGVLWWIEVSTPGFLDKVRVGDSIAVSGCCLTVVERQASRFACQLGEETLQRTTFRNKRPGDRVNLERSLSLGDALGGHLVTGHIDGVGQVVEQRTAGDWQDCWIETTPELLMQMAEKGSVAVDGVSLTLCEVTEHAFRVALIPHTLQVTTLGQLKIGSQVNIETDILAKYVARQLAAWRTRLLGDAS
jgi:riboflavin synthase